MNLLRTDLPDGTPSDDERLLARFRERDRAAFDILYERYAGRLLAFARRLTGNPTEAEDLVQETFVAAYQGAERFQGHSRLLTYLFAIAVRRHWDNKRKPVVPQVALSEETDSETGWSPSVEGAVLFTITFEQALATLDVRHKEAFLLVAAQGLIYRETALVLNLPIGTVKWRVAEATKRLRIALQEERPDARTPDGPMPAFPRR